MTTLAPIVPRAEAIVGAPADAIPDRYELKYLVSEEEIDAVRRAIRPYCVLDPHSAKSPTGEYAIQSLYLDTPDRDLYRISRERRAKRWKARVRTYDGADVVFFEIKNKDHDLIKKNRARVPAAGWQERIHRLDLATTPAERAFVERVERYSLVPTVMVRYLREAWMSTVDSYARVTFDRRVVCQPWSEWTLDCEDCAWLALDSAYSMWSVPTGVVLELKCLTAVPVWLSEVVRQVGLRRTRYSKFCKGIERLWERDTLLGVLHQT